MGRHMGVALFALLFCFVVPFSLSSEAGPQNDGPDKATAKREEVLRIWEENSKSIEARRSKYKEELHKEISFRYRNETIRKLWEKYRPRNFHPKNPLKRDDDVPPFHCAPLPASAEVPTSVHQLRPADIKVVAAMGDSLTAGTGISANWILEELIENRGLSWSGGGQGNYDEHITVPNILKNYNPNVRGFATGNGDEFSKNSKFNVAVAGSVSGELMEQVYVLIDRMKKDPAVDFENDWKLLTILSGNNDLCDYCNEPEFTAENYKKNIMAVLDVLHAEMPRTLVNLVEPLNMEIVTELNKGILCAALHYFICDCAAFPDNAEKAREIIHMADMYQLATEEIAMSGRYDTRDDFTVVCQPFFNQTYVPYEENGQPDLSFFAPDCFHLSEKGQEAAASALWNNMVESLPVKRTEWTPGELIECPTEANPYIYTNKNSVAQKSAAHQDTEEGPSTELLVVGAVTGVAVVAIVGAVVIAVRRHRRNLYIQI